MPASGTAGACTRSKRKGQPEQQTRHNTRARQHEEPQEVEPVAPQEDGEVPPPDAAADVAVEDADATQQPEQQQNEELRPSPQAEDMDRVHYHSLYDAADKSLVEAATAANNMMTIYVRFVSAPHPDIVERLPEYALPLEVPRTSTVRFVKRAICRQAEGQMWPSMQLMRHPESKEELKEVQGTGPSTSAAAAQQEQECTLMQYKIEDGGLVEIELQTADPESPRRAMRPNGAAAAAEAARADAEMEDVNAWPPSPPKNRKSRKPWGAEEVRVLLKGIREFGLAWSRIHDVYSSQLSERSQVNLKDKWRNLCLQCQNNFRDERGERLPEELKNQVRSLKERLGSGGDAQ